MKNPYKLCVLNGYEVKPDSVFRRMALNAFWWALLVLIPILIGIGLASIS